MHKQTLKPQDDAPNMIKKRTVCELGGRKACFTECFAEGCKLHSPCPQVPLAYVAQSATLTATLPMSAYAAASSDGGIPSASIRRRTVRMLEMMKISKEELYLI